MFKHRSQSLSGKKRLGLNQIVAGFAALVVTAIMTVSGFAAAAPNRPPNTDRPPSKEECEREGYRNYGQCVRDWAHAKHGNGYGGTNITIIIIINIILNNSNFNNIQNNIQINFR